MKNIYVNTYSKYDDSLVFTDDNDQELSFNYDYDIFNSCLHSDKLSDKVFQVDGLKILDLQKFLEVAQDLSLENQDEYSNFATVNHNGKIYKLDLELHFFDTYAVFNVYTPGGQKVYSHEYFPNDGFGDAWFDKRYNLILSVGARESIRDLLSESVTPTDYYYHLKEVLDANFIQYHQE